MDLWFISAAKEVDNRAKGYVNDVESYIELRRDLSGCKSCFALIEFASQIDLPDEVVSHPVIKALEEATNDFVSWSNVIPHSIVEVKALLTSLLIGYFLLQPGAISQ
jgi:hypothetical protein